MDCHLENNKKNCNCTYDPCPRKGACCQCISYHTARKELPACCFPAAAEKTYDRSFRHFSELVRQGKA